MDVFWKEIQLSTTLSKNRESQISMLSMPKMCFKLLLKIVSSFKHFLNFSQDVFVSLSNLFFKNLSSEAKGQDKSIRQAWTDLLLIRIWNFERKLKIMLSLCYLLHLFLILAITCCSKFQLIRNYVFWKEIQFSITFIEIEKSKFESFPGQKCDSNCC